MIRFKCITLWPVNTHSSRCEWLQRWNILIIHCIRWCSMLCCHFWLRMVVVKQKVTLDEKLNLMWSKQGGFFYISCTQSYCVDDIKLHLTVLTLRLRNPSPFFLSPRSTSSSAKAHVNFLSKTGSKRWFCSFFSCCLESLYQSSAVDGFLITQASKLHKPISCTATECFQSQSSST